MRQFTLKQLRYFVVAGELGSVTGAAKQLYVSQPSISAAIHQIEEMTGLQLFVRHHAQGLSLTPSGRQLMTRARQLLRDSDNLMQYAMSLGDTIAGELKLVAFPTFAPVFLPRLLRKYADAYPDVNLSCHEMTQEDILKGLHNGEYELAFAYDLQLPQEIEFTPLSRFPPYAVVAEDHPLARQGSVSLARLIEHPMVLLDWPQSREYFLSLFEAEGIVPDIIYRAKSLDMIRGLVANGFGFSLFNTPLTTDKAFDGKRLVALTLEEDARPLSMGIASLRHLTLSPAAEAMRQLASRTDLVLEPINSPRSTPSSSTPDA
ncbi:LysR family transcriptional regulator [Larsenimonas rhizosphaerae]|uniref:LysR family transcriptional regulator n=1 Tax=Larsenimonas rhizosphaerae TaxID=2944682 RepID=UPI0020346522|nr:LysR family transcriptional regulator [Larsenimonas rhizosphaerae]MCM2131254.1 LysR family transcriptional regulator [Larsenimonas rhizosphaerae]